MPVLYNFENNLQKFVILFPVQIVVEVLSKTSSEYASFPFYSEVVPLVYNAYTSVIRPNTRTVGDECTDAMSMSLGST